MKQKKLELRRSVKLVAMLLAAWGISAPTEVSYAQEVIAPVKPPVIENFVSPVMDDEQVPQPVVGEDIVEEPVVEEPSSPEPITEAQQPVMAEPTTEATTVATTETRDVVTSSAAMEWAGPVLSRRAGTVQGPSGKETYYNLPMQGVVSIMQNMGVNEKYWVRSDGVKMYGSYIMCAADLNVHPRGSLVETSLGTAMVCDTGGFAVSNHHQLDIAVEW